MTTLEFILTIILWLFVGIWICSKREWYGSDGDDDFVIRNIFAIIIAPLNFLWTFIDIYVISKWDNTKI